MSEGPRGLLIAAPASGSGKTTVTLGILAALGRRGVEVASAKAGPDFIDPGFHRAATGRDCLTLDPWAADAVQLRARAAGAAGRLLIVEGAMGLFDGADDGSAAGAGASADLAAALDLPVVLVVDAARSGQGLAAVIAGLVGWRRDVRVAGIILNRTGSARHAAMAARAVAPVAEVLGVLPREEGLATPSRHLGLVQAEERRDLAEFLDHAADRVAAHVDLDRLVALAGPLQLGGSPRRLPPPGQRVAVARDTAFGFAYPHMLADWRTAGAELAFFSPLADEPPDPAADALFLPGGYPELHAGRIAGAARFLAGLSAAAARGTVIHGECGGYMVLGRGLVDADGTRHAMADLLPLETDFSAPARTLGYRRLTALAGPWAGATLRGHEFHYARTLTAEGPPLYRATDAAGEDLGPLGLAVGRVSGSFAHVVEVG